MGPTSPAIVKAARAIADTEEQIQRIDWILQHDAGIRDHEDGPAARATLIEAQDLQARLLRSLLDRRLLICSECQMESRNDQPERIHLKTCSKYRPEPCSGCGGLAGECPPLQGCRYDP